MSASTKSTQAPVIDANVIDANVIDVEIAQAAAAINQSWTMEQIESRQDTLTQLVVDTAMLGGLVVTTVIAAKAACLATLALGTGALATAGAVIAVGAVVATAIWLIGKFASELVAVSTWVGNNLVAAYEWLKDKCCRFWNWLCSFFTSDEVEA